MTARLELESLDSAKAQATFCLTDAIANREKTRITAIFVCLPDSFCYFNLARYVYLLSK